MRRAVAVVAALLLLAGCTSDADVASNNIAKDAEQFKILRRIVFFNGVTDTYLLSIEGFCSVETADSKVAGSVEVTCKVENGYKKHAMGLSDNVSYFVEQLDAANVSTSRYKVIFKPSTIVPDVEVAR